MATTKPYHLRKRSKSRGSVCYLREALEDENMIQKYDPKVRLKRLNLQDVDFNPSTTFRFKNNKILIMREAARVGSTNSWTAIFITAMCAVALLYLMHIYRDNLLEFYDRVLFGRDLKKEKTICRLKEGISWSQNASIELQIKEIIRSQVEELGDGSSERENETGSRSGTRFADQPEKEDSSREASQLSSEVGGDFVDEFFATNSLTDYALESKGAKILSTANTEPYGVLTLRFWNHELEINNSFVQKFLRSNGPTSVLIPWTKPGDCWAFRGPRGKILIELSEKIVISAVSVDHIRSDALPKRSIQAAPNRFSVIGFPQNGSKLSTVGVHFGSFNYNVTGPVMQTFLIRSTDVRYKVVEVSFESNHGNEDYTCIYKIRVHGFP